MSQEDRKAIIDKYMGSVTTLYANNMGDVAQALTENLQDIATGDIGTLTDKYGGSVPSLILNGDMQGLIDMYTGHIGMSKHEKPLLAQYGVSDEAMNQLIQSPITRDDFNASMTELMNQDDSEVISDRIESFKVGVFDRIENTLAPASLKVSDTLGDLGIDWNDVENIYYLLQLAKPAWSLLTKFFGGAAGAGAAGGATALGGKIASLGSTIWGGIQTAGSTIGGAIGGTAGAIALAIPAILGYLGFKDAKAQSKAWEEKTAKEQEDELRKKVKQYMQEEEVIKDQSKSSSQFDAYGMHRNGLDKVPFDGYKAILHSGEAVLTRDEAQKYRANPNILKHSEKDLEVFSKNTEAMNRNEAFAQRTLSLLDKIKSKEVLGKAKETAQGVYDRLKTMSTSSTTSSDSTNPSTGGTFDSSGNYAEDTWRFLRSLNYSKEATAGILGNMEQESGVNPTRIQGNGRGPAAGIVQWENINTKSKRWKQMADYAASKGKEWTDLQSQLEFLDMELAGVGSVDKYTSTLLKRKAGSYDAFKSINSVNNAVKIFHDAFERSSKPNWNRRYSAANDYYSKFNKYEQGTPYVPTDQIALLHKGEMVVPKDQNPMNSGKTISTSNDDIKEDLKTIIQVLQWGFEFMGKKYGEEKIVQQSTAARKLETLNDRYQNRKLGR